PSSCRSPTRSISGSRSSSSSRCCRWRSAPSRPPGRPKSNPFWPSAPLALWQTHIKRLMAYSSIGHMGYALLGLAAGTQLGLRGVLFYLAFYSLTNIGVFACIQAMRRDGKAVEDIYDLAGLARTKPRLAFAFAAMMLSLSGLPPLAGILAKAFVFLAAIQAHLYVLAM